MSARELSGTRRYHPTNMPRRDPGAQAILNRHAGKEVEDEFSAKLPEMNPETAKHFANTSSEVKIITEEVVPMIVNRMAKLEESQARSDELAVKRDKEINDKFDAVMMAIAGLGVASKGKKAKPQQPAAVEDFQGEEDELPPAER